jgi:pimeloyl-ACP methyl ester carboxylesterase
VNIIRPIAKLHAVAGCLAWCAGTVPGAVAAPLEKDVFTVGGHTAFLLEPPVPAPGKPWVWFAPVLDKVPDRTHDWYFQRLIAAGISVAGLNQGEVRGAPGSTQNFTAFYEEMVRRGFSKGPVLLGQSRGGLMLLAWAMRHPEKIAAFAGIYPVCNLASWPLLNSKPAVLRDYGLPEAELLANLAQYNPVDNLQGLLANKVPLFIVHGDDDELVPYDTNGKLLKERYEAGGGSVTFKMIAGEGHKVSPAFFQCPELIDFVLARAKPDQSNAPVPPQ